MPEAQAPAAPAGTQENPIVTTPVRRAVENGMRQDGVINQIKEQHRERAKAAGRAASQFAWAQQKAAEDAARAAASATVAGGAGTSVVTPVPGTTGQVIIEPSVPPTAAVAPPAAAPTLTSTSSAAISPSAPAALAASASTAPTAAAAPATTFANKQVEVTWNTIREMESKLAEARKQHAAEIQAFRADQNKPAQDLAALQNALKNDPLPVLQQLGYTVPQLANRILTAYPAPGSAPTTAPATTPAQPVFAPPPAAPQVAAPANSEVAELKATITTLQNAFIAQSYNAELRDKDFEVLRTQPDAVQRALGTWNRYYQATGQQLTVRDACVRAQEELISAKKAELAGNPALLKAVGFSEAPPPQAAPPPAAPAAPPAAPSAPGITTLSSDLAPGGFVPPVSSNPTEPWLPPELVRKAQMLKRATEAARAALPR